MSIASPISEAQRCMRLTVDVPIRRDVAYGGKQTLACQAKQGSAWKKGKAGAEWRDEKKRSGYRPVKRT
ncbi:hypothetical protein [Burkholderia cenocepacia]|uniref:hypothetical protein n=1 Tax=Burkholderia cenocepacia TaxID=95486 RepID=UPI001CF58D21|nr:hypothetical protein [Burkholderia cenocepacia]MCA7963570.1 hypothetical protein [Burkholderia cenocepacia]MDS0850293.1 hypothetical protein [Burkholderia cenocepacia]